MIKKVMYTVLAVISSIRWKKKSVQDEHEIFLGSDRY